ncbi:MAG: exodeoxyribonuclease VII large subunit [Candidatus Omnitrophica bacterium]|nr:exodeoxyribonuclease VII large subunit [Candidatus Omnitrophota bacterium]
MPPVITNNYKATRHIYTVSEITRDIKIILENTFAEVWVEGEVSNFRSSLSGHFYFSLKDEFAILTAVVFSRTAQEIKFKLKDGLKVICFGRIEVYGLHGRYQLIIEKIEPKGIGALQLALEQLKEKLEKEGFFRLEHKRPLPYLPGKIGIITSLHGAAIKDILKVLERRFRDIQIIINPVRVQGEGAKEEISQAIKDFNCFNQTLPPQERIEVIIITRGGGSTEDLWAFNEEIVARTIYQSKIPVISAVGHERDVTIADLVADSRAATPSVAAEMVIPKKEDLKERLGILSQRLKGACLDILENFQVTLEGLGHRLMRANPGIKLEEYLSKLKDLSRQMYVHIGHFIELKKSAFLGLVEKFTSLNPLNILARGYSITFKLPEGKILKEVKGIKAGDYIRTRLYEGEFTSKVEKLLDGRNKI